MRPERPGALAAWAAGVAILVLHDVNDELHQQAARLAAMVDNYFTAWQEASSVLARRERELAELRRSVKPKLVGIRK